MGFDGLFENISFVSATNRCGFGLEYVRRNQHLDASGILLEEIKAMLEAAKETYAQMLRSLNFHDSGGIRIGLKRTDHEITTFVRARDFIDAASFSDFSVEKWKKGTRWFITKVNLILSGKPLPEEEIIILQQFLNETSSMLLAEIAKKQHAYIANRGLKPI